MSASKRSDEWMEEVTDEVLSWPGVSRYPERFGGNAFRFNTAEVGHIHHGGAVHIPFPRPVHDELLAQGLAEIHPYAPDTGMVSFQIKTAEDVEHALWLMRLSYLRYALKQAAEPGTMLVEESERLKLSPQLRALMQTFARGKPMPPPVAQTEIRKDTL